jgi:hypothetical protein
MSFEGMQMVWAIGTADQIRTVPLEESQGFLSYGGDVYGNETHTPTYHHYFTPADHCHVDYKGKGASPKEGKTKGSMDE